MINATPCPFYPCEWGTTHCVGQWVVPWSSLDNCIKSPPPVFDTWSAQSVACLYTDYAVPANPSVCWQMWPEFLRVQWNLKMCHWCRLADVSGIYVFCMKAWILTCLCFGRWDCISITKIKSHSITLLNYFSLSLSPLLPWVLAGNCMLSVLVQYCLYCIRWKNCKSLSVRWNMIGFHVTCSCDKVFILLWFRMVMSGLY